MNTILSEQHARRTVKFNDDRTSSQETIDRPIRTVNAHFRLMNHESISNIQSQTESDEVEHTRQTNFNIEDSKYLLTEEEYIPGGFNNLDRELEDELFNDFTDEFDDTAIRKNRNTLLAQSSDHAINVTRSPIDLWKRARILIAMHLYKIQNKTLNPHDNTLSSSLAIDPLTTKNIDDNKMSIKNDDFNYYLDKSFQHKENLNERQITFGLSVLEKFSIESSQRYQCVDFYDVEQGYIIMSNVINLNELQFNIKNYSYIEQRQLYKKSNNIRCENSKLYSEPPPKTLSLTQHSKLLVYSIDKKSSHQIQSVEFECSFQFEFMICIPIFRLILGFMNVNNEKSLMIIIGDASRKGCFLSKQEIPHYIYSILYIHESNMIFIGCMGHVLIYKTQPLQFTSQPLFMSDIGNLPFLPMESIIHICQVTIHRAIGLLSNQRFVLWQYTPNENILVNFCNPYRYDFIRCLYIPKFDYIIFAFIDGFMLIYTVNQMELIRRYQHHWKMITNLANSKDQNILLSSSIDHIINVWNLSREETYYYVHNENNSFDVCLETLQHLYQYNTNEEIFQIDVINENLFYYRTLKSIILFKLNLRTILFSITQTKVKSLKLFMDRQRIGRIIALNEDDSSRLISPVSGCCLTYVSNIAKKPIKQILHDISRSTIYSLQFDGDIVLYHADNNPCVANYIIRTKHDRNMITCMTLINPMRTQLLNVTTIQTSIEKSLEKQIIFFGHANGYISLFQGDRFIMEPILAHQGPIVCLETSQVSMERSKILFTHCEIILSSSVDRVIHLWNLSINKVDDTIQLIHILTIEQDKNISLESIKFLSMIDNFIVANYSDQYYLHIWQLLNISIRTDVHDQWGIVEHPTKGNHHHSKIQGISATPNLKLFASSDIEGTIKIWDSTNSLLREIYLDKSLGAIEFLLHNGELIIAYQNNIHLILPEDYLPNYKNLKIKQQISTNIIAENDLLEVSQPLSIPYQSLPIFNYRIKTHHSKQRLQIFERQLAGRFTVVNSDSSQSDDENPPLSNNDRLSMISEDSDWFELAEDVKDLLRMKKYEIQHQNKSLQ